MPHGDAGSDWPRDFKKFGGRVRLGRHRAAWLLADHPCTVG